MRDNWGSYGNLSQNHRKDARKTFVRKKVARKMLMNWHLENCEGQARSNRRREREGERPHWRSRTTWRGTEANDATPSSWSQICKLFSLPPSPFRLVIHRLKHFHWRKGSLTCRVHRSPVGRSFPSKNLSVINFNNFFEQLFYQSPLAKKHKQKPKAQKSYAYKLSMKNATHKMVLK